MPSPSAEPSQAAGGPATIEAPDSVEGGEPFEVEWTGPDGEGDYVTLVAEGAEAWTNEPYFYTATGSPGNLTAPTTAGDYELWYVVGSDESIAVRLPITVTPFEGDLGAPDTVGSGTTFEVAWNGPDGPGDYVTIVPVGAERWTNESYFYTTVGSPGTLTAPNEAGDYEIWYVPGADTAPTARRPIEVTQSEVTLDAPASIGKGAEFEVTWTGPNGPGDYVTITAVGAPPNAYLSYAYTNTGPTIKLTAPAESGSFEVRYVTGRVATVLATSPLQVN
jgi:Ca-activated chloride channel family protein